MGHRMTYWNPAWSRARSVASRPLTQVAGTRRASRAACARERLGLHAKQCAVQLHHLEALAMPVDVVAQCPLPEYRLFQILLDSMGNGFDVHLEFLLAFPCAASSLICVATCKGRYNIAWIQQRVWIGRQNFAESIVREKRILFKLSRVSKIDGF